MAADSKSTSATDPDPERIDEDNPEWTREDLRNARPASEALPKYIGGNAADELLESSKRRREQREWEQLRAYGQARLRARLHAEGLDLDRMSEDEVMDYIDRVIHEAREEDGRRTDRAQSAPPKLCG